MMKQRYSILRQAADSEGVGELKVISDFPNRGAALKEAKKYRAAQVEARGEAWADTFYIAILEAV